MKEKYELSQTKKKKSKVFVASRSTLQEIFKILEIEGK